MLQPTERAKVRLFLGYPDQFRYKDTRLESMLDQISDEAETQIRSTLVVLDQIDTLITTTGLANAGIKRVDEVWFFAAGAMLDQQRKTGRQYVARLSIILGVGVNSDIFGTSGYLGDNFGSGLGEPNGSGRFYGVG